MFLLPQEHISHSFLLISAGSLRSFGISNCYFKTVFARIWGLAPPSALPHEEDAKTPIKVDILVPSPYVRTVEFWLCQRVWSKNGLQAAVALNYSYHLRKGSAWVQQLLHNEETGTKGSFKFNIQHTYGKVFIIRTVNIYLAHCFRLPQSLKVLLWKD